MHSVESVTTCNSHQRDKATTTMKPSLIAAIGLSLIACHVVAGDLPVPTRQVHLDFHTSEHIPGIGERFNRQQWQAALRPAM